MLALRTISVATFSDSLLSSETWVRGLGKFLIVTLYTSYVLNATQQHEALVMFTAGCRAAEVVILLGGYGMYLLGYTEVEDSFSYEF